jgi:glutamyl-tRNA reductase
MRRISFTDLQGFYVAGINYKKTDAALRGQFAIQEEQYASIIRRAKDFGIRDLFILSTCNRTEIYGFAEQAEQLISLLCSGTIASREQFSALAYIRKGREAVDHLFQVSAGLDSQILGDYEIIGQIKTAVKFAREQGMVSTIMERLVNTTLQSSKAIKNQTKLSDGTVSVSFAAVQYIRENVTNIADKKILLAGIGKIGRNTCKNLVDYLDTKNITLINRSPDKASMLATEMGVDFAPWEELTASLKVADIILVATDSSQPTILASQIENAGEKLIIDLSIPCNVEEIAAHLANVKIVNVDELSRLKDATLAKREAEIPKARQIIAEHVTGFYEWVDMRKHVPVLKAVKVKLQEIQNNPLFYTAHPNFGDDNGEKIQRVITGMASKMKRRDQRGCQYIEAINEFMAEAGN